MYIRYSQHQHSTSTSQIHLLYDFDFIPNYNFLAPSSQPFKLDAQVNSRTLRYKLKSRLQIDTSKRNRTRDTSIAFGCYACLVFRQKILQKTILVVTNLELERIYLIYYHRNYKFQLHRLLYSTLKMFVAYLICTC